MWVHQGHHALNTDCRFCWLWRWLVILDSRKAEACPHLGLVLNQAANSVDFIPDWWVVLLRTVQSGTVQPHELLSDIHAKSICLSSPLRDPWICGYLAFPYTKPSGGHRSFISWMTSAAISVLLSSTTHLVGVTKGYQQPTRSKKEKNTQKLKGCFWFLLR